LKNHNKIEVLLKEQLLFLLYCKETSTITSSELDSLTNGVKFFLKEFDDIFSKELPSGLPPLSGIEHQIDLVS